MEFLSTLPLDVKILLVGGALMLLFGLFTGSKKTEQRCMMAFTVFMVAAGVRFYMEGQVDHGQAHDPTAKVIPDVRVPLESTHADGRRKAKTN